jgi:hypothetical protein
VRAGGAEEPVIVEPRAGKGQWYRYLFAKKSGDVMEMALLVMFLLLTKHYLCDFVLQSFPWMYLNKGTYGHPGGLAHVAVHWLGSVLVLTPVLGASALLFWVIAAEIVAHYHIDWAKVKYCVFRKWGPLNSSEYWWILGFDQLLHNLCYIAMTWWVLR